VAVRRSPVSGEDSSALVAQRSTFDISPPSPSHAHRPCVLAFSPGFLFTPLSPLGCNSGCPFGHCKLPLRALTRVCGILLFFCLWAVALTLLIPLLFPQAFLPLSLVAGSTRQRRRYNILSYPSRRTFPPTQNDALQDSTPLPVYRPFVSPAPPVSGFRCPPARLHFRLEFHHVRSLPGSFQFVLPSVLTSGIVSFPDFFDSFSAISW